MSAGGAQGLEYGPFPQDLPKLKKLTTGRGGDVESVDTELQWIRKQSLVEGFYQVTGRLLTNRQGVIASGLKWLWSIPDAANALVNITAFSMSYFVGNGVQQVADWSGDGGARYTTLIPGQNEVQATIWHGTLFIPTPGPVSLTWSADAADIAPVELLQGSTVRLQLMR